MAKARRILVLDDRAGDAELAALVLGARLPGCRVEVVPDAATFVTALADDVAAIVTEQRLAWSDGPSIVRAVRRARPSCRIILFSEPGCDDALSAALEEGLDGYVVKGSAGFVRLAGVVGRLLGVVPQAVAPGDSAGNGVGSGNGGSDGRARLHGVIAALTAKTVSLERSNRELEQFAYVVSHDLQEPLNLTARFARLLAERVGGQLDEEATGCLDHVIANTTRLQTMIDDVLAYARVGTRGRPFTPVPVSEIVHQAVADLAAAVEDCDAEVVVGPLPVVVADGRQLAQVFQNLIANALKFRSDQRPRVEVTARDSAEGHVFAVRDNGIGIAPEHHERIFEMFQRLHTESEIPGTGIGLAICSRIIARHEGRIWVESQPGGGATFLFLIPGTLAERAGAKSETAAGDEWPETHWTS